MKYFVIEKITTLQKPVQRFKSL